MPFYQLRTHQSLLSLEKKCKQRSDSLKLNEVVYTCTAEFDPW